MSRLPINCLATLLFLFAFAMAHAKKPDNKFTETAITPLPKGASVVVLPLNPNGHLRNNEASVVTEAIFEQLRAIGATPQASKKFDAEERQDYFLLTDSRAYGAAETAKVKETYIAGLSGEQDLTIIPSVYETLGHMDRELISFDGAKIKIATTSRSGGWWTGQQRGLSLRFEVYDNQGNWLMTLHGGFSMPRIAIMKTRGFVRKEDLFATKKDKKYLAKGVKIVTKPMVKQLKFR